VRADRRLTSPPNERETLRGDPVSRRSALAKTPACRDRSRPAPRPGARRSQSFRRRPRSGVSRLRGSRPTAGTASARRAGQLRRRPPATLRALGLQQPGLAHQPLQALAVDRVAVEFARGQREVSARSARGQRGDHRRAVGRVLARDVEDLAIDRVQRPGLTVGPSSGPGVRTGSDTRRRRDGPRRRATDRHPAPARPRHHLDLYLQGIDNARSSTPSTPAARR
jgi:hypothetical protein